MNLWITVDGQKTRLVVPDEDTIIMVERDYQERLEAAEDKSTVQRRTPQAILNTLYGRERDGARSLHDHWVRPTSDNEEDALDAYETFAVARKNQGSGYSYRNLENLSTGSAEDMCVDALMDKDTMQLLRDNLTPEQIELVTEVVFKRRKQVDYAAEKQVSKSAITQQMNTIRKKLKKILPQP